MIDSPEKSRLETAWWPLVVPFAVFMILTMFEPGFGDEQNIFDAELPGAAAELESVDAMETDPDTLATSRRYFFIYSAKILLVLAFLLFFARLYLGHFPFKCSWWAVLFGVLGTVLWIGLCELQVEKTIAALIGLPETWFLQRSGINPFRYYTWGLPLFAFLLVRFAGLVIIVPIIEEMVLRGFFIRYLEDSEWWKVKFNQLGWFPLLMAPVYGVLSHPMSELLAAASWFGLITWLMVKTRNLWDCILAHAITNFLLGVYVVSFQRWYLW